MRVDVGTAPALSLRGQVLGQERIGVQVASLITFLSLSLRVPVRRIQACLRTLYPLSISTREIVELLHQVYREV